MRRTSGSRWVPAALLAFTAACESPVETEPAPTISLSIVSGSGQTGAVGTELSRPLVVRVTTQKNKKTVGVADQLVNFRIVTGDGSVYAGSALTDPQGMAQDYWTLGPEAGENLLEVRAVDPSTGEKHVYATFNAFGIIPGPELCNGLDDNLDGTVDNPSWAYCNAGVPRANTDGISCLPNYLDLNAIAADGCERLAAGRWVLSPAVTFSCPSLPPGLNTVSLAGFDIGVVSPTELSVTPSVTFGVLGGLLTFALQNIPVSVVPVAETFGGTATGTFSKPLTDELSVFGALTSSMNGSFTGAASFQATLSLSLNLTVRFVGIDLHQICEPLDVTVTGTRITGP